MKPKISVFYIYIIFLVVVCIFTGCPFGLWHEDKYTTLENTSATISVDKECFISEEPEIDIVSKADFSEYDKYVFTVKVSEFDEQTNSFKNQIIAY